MQDIASPNSTPAARRSSVALWVIAVSLAVIALCLLMRLDDSRRGLAFAQPSGSGGARGVFAFTGQLTKDSYGVFMVDVDAGTLWCYRYMGGKDVLTLVAARDWRFDRYLQEWGTQPPIATVKAQLDQQRAAITSAGASGANGP